VTTPAPPTPHTHAWKTTVEDGDVDYYSSDAQRTEMGMGNPTRRRADGVDREQRQDDVRFIAYNLYIPSSFDSGDWCALNQNKGNGGSGNGPLGLYIWRGKLDLRKSTSQVTTSETTSSVYLTPRAVPRDTWLRFLIEVKWSTGSDGYYAFYGDIGDGRGFQTLLSRTSGWTLKNSITVHSRLGIYRQAIRGTHSVYWAGFNVADTRADATTFAFGRSL
jgi:polysaccharide lyase-like protein